MTREDLEKEVRKRMNGEYEPQEIQEDICEHCSSAVDENPYTESIPEHGGESEHRVVWCDEQCKSEWLDESLK